MKKDFPILNRKVNGYEVAYLDNAATSQKPVQVIDAITGFYSNHNANVHRGLHVLSEEATRMYESARKKVAGFIDAGSSDEIIFTRGTTESLNFVAFTWGVSNLKQGGTILTTDAEHHSNLVPWQVVAEKTGAKLVYLNIGEDGLFDLAAFKSLLNNSVKVVAISHASNVLGTIFPVKEIIQLVRDYANKHGIEQPLIVVDGAQAVPHIPVRVRSLDCDFYAFSGHKMLGPTGIGVLWGKKKLLEKLEPYQYGGGMINTVSMEKSTWAPLPDKFEAGTPNFTGAIGLSAAIDYLEEYGMENVRNHEIELNKYVLDKLSTIPEVKVLGPREPKQRTGLVAFTVTGIHPHDIAAVLDSAGIAVRSGHHCCMPFHTKHNLPGTLRASYYLYNTREDIDRLVGGVQKAINMLR